MAEYKVEGPDGKIITMEGPDNATDEQILGFAKQQYLANLPPDYSLGQLAGKAFDRGLERFKSTYGDVLPAMVGSALGFDDYAKRQMEEAAQSERKIQETMRPQFASFRDVNWANPIDISKFIVETTGEQIPNLAGVLVPGGVGAKVGEKLATKAAIKKLSPKISDEASKKLASKFAKIPNPAVAKGRNIGQISGVFLGSYGLNAPEVFRNIYEQTGSFEPGAAALAGVVNASLDSILPATLLNQFSRPGRATIVSEILERSGMNPNLARKAVVQIAGSGVLEGLTEATQEAVSITAENFVQDHSYLFDSEDFERLLEGGVRGTVAGGTFRGVGVAAGKLRDKYNKFVEDKKDAEEGDTGDTGDTGDVTPPAVIPEEQQLLLEQQRLLPDKTIYGRDLTGPRQLELDLEGGPVQGELDLQPVDTTPGQLNLNLGDTNLSVPDPVQVDPRQSELDFDQEQFVERPYFSNKIPVGPQTELEFEGQPEGQFAPVQRDLFFKDIPTLNKPITPTPTLKTKSKVKISKPSKQGILSVKKGQPLYHGTLESQIKDINNNQNVLSSQSPFTRGVGVVTEGGLVWFSQDEKVAKREFTKSQKGQVGQVATLVPKKPLKIIDREAKLTKKQTNLLNKEMFKRLNINPPTINNAKKKYGSYVVAREGQNLNYYVSEVKEFFPTYKAKGLESQFEDNLYVIWPTILKTLNFDGFYYGPKSNQIALTGDQQVEFEDISTTPTTPTSKAKPKAKPKTTTVDPKLVGKEVEVSVAGVKQKGTYVDMQGTPFISSPIPQKRGGGTQSQAIPANAKVKEVKVKKEKPLKSIRKGNPADEKIINKLKSKKTLGPVLNILKRSDVTPAQKELATLLLTIPNISKTDFKVIENLEFQDNAYGQYIRQKDLIQISNNADVETVLHEAVHAATANLLNKHIRDGVGITPLGRRIVRVYEEAVAADVNGRFATELSNVDEFIAESFANKDFQKFLARSESSTSSRGEDEAYIQSLINQGVSPNVRQNIIRERAGVRGLLESLWGRFVNAIKDMLSIEDVNFSYSILNDVIALAPELFVGPNKREQAQATQEVLFKKTDVVEEVLASGNAVPKYTKEAKIPKNIQQIAETIGRQPIANNAAGRALVSRLSNLPQSILNLYAGILSIPQQIELFGEKLPALNDVRRILQSKAFEIKQGREDIERIVAYGETLKKKYLATTQGEKILEEWNKVLLELSGLDINPETILADPNGLTNLAKENAKGAALVRRYEKLPKDLKDYANQIVTDLETRYNLLLETVIAANPNASEEFKNSLRERFKTRPYYLPFIRKGEFWFEYKTRDGEYGISSTDSNASRTLLIEKMQREEGITDVKLVTKASVKGASGTPPGDFVVELQRTIAALQENESVALTSEQLGKINESIEETYLAMFPEESLRYNQQTRQAIPGYIEDIIFAYANVAPKIESSMANQKYNNELLTAVNAVARQANEPENAPNNLLRAVADDVVKRSDFMMNPIAGPVSRYAAYGSYFWFLGFNVSSAVVNITQLPLVVLPYLSGEYGGPKLGQERTFTEMKDAMKLYFQGGFEQTERFAPDRTMAQVKINLQTGEKTYVGKNAKLFRPGGRYHDLFNRAEDAAALRRGVGYEITELSKDLGAPLETGGRLKAKTEKLVGYLFQNSERLNREVTLVTAFEMEMKYGSGNKDVAIQKAIEFTAKVHSHALPEVGPRFFQDGIGKIAFVFKRFAQAQAYLIIKLFNDGPIGFSRKIKNDPNLTEEEKQQRLAEKQMAKRQLAGIYGYSFLMAGAAGVPAYGLASMIIEGIFDEDDEPFDLDTFISQSVGDMAYRGPLSYAIGADISRRTGFRNLFYQEDPRRLDEIGLPTYVLETIGGPAFAIFKRVATAPEFLERGQELRALERVMPTSIGNSIKALRQSMEGVRNKNGVKIIEDDPSLYETFMQVVGFTNPEVSEAYMRAQALKGPEKRLTQLRSSLLTRYWLAFQEGDTDAVANIDDEIREFNKKAPRGLRITPSTKRRSVKAKQRLTKDSVFGVNLPRTYKDEIEDVYDIDTGNMLDLDIFD